jgi:hypothetical protein
MTPKEIYDLIERHFNHELSQEEQIMFDLKVKNDPDFAKEVVAQVEANKILLDQGLLNIKDRLRKIHEAETKGNDSGKWKTYLAGVVALVALVTSVNYFYNSSSKTESPVTNVVTAPSEKNTTVTTENKKEVINLNEKENTTENNSKKENSSIVPPADKKTIQDNVQVKDTVQTKKNVPFVIPSPLVSKNDTVTTKKKPAAVDCSTVTIVGDVNSSGTCTDKSTGNIIVNLSSVKGGNKPYMFSIDGSDEYKGSSQFYDLPVGHYKVTAKDRNNCVSLLQEVDIKSKDCPQEYAFAPGRAELFTFPMKGYTDGEIKILNQGGQIIYHTSINNGYPSAWNGTNNSGIELSMGVYMFVITYSNGEINKGYVTILK